MCDRNNDVTNSLSKNYTDSRSQTVKNTSSCLESANFNSSSMLMSNQPRSTQSCDNGLNRINTLNNNNNNNNGFQSLRRNLIDGDDIDAPRCQTSSNITRSGTTSLRLVQSMNDISNMPIPHFANSCSSNYSNYSNSSYGSIGDIIDTPARSDNSYYWNKSNQFNQFTAFTSNFNNAPIAPIQQKSFPMNTFASEESTYQRFKGHNTNYQSEAVIQSLNEDFDDFNLDDIPVPKALSTQKVASNKDSFLSHAPQQTFVSNAKNEGFRNISKNVEEEEVKEDIIMEPFYVPSKLECNNKPIEELELRKQNDGCMVKPQYYNEYTSCVMCEAPLHVLQTLVMLLNHIYSAYIPNKDNINKDSKKNRNIREVDVTKVSKDDFTIKGIAYVKHKGVKFVISIWHETINSGLNGIYETRVELQRHHGESMIFHQFWSELLELMHNKFNNVSGAIRCPDFETFFMPTFDLSDIEMEDADNSDNDSINNKNNNKWKVEDFDEMAMDLIADYREEGLDILATICDNVGKDDLFIHILCEHDELIKVLIKTLKHLDVCHVRGALCALDQMIEKMAEINDNNINNPRQKQDRIDYIVSSSSILGNLANLIQHKSKLIKRRAEMLMGRLADVTKCEWNLGYKVKEQIDAWVVQFADNDSNYNYDGIDVIKMLNNIKNKLYS